MACPKCGRMWLKVEKNKLICKCGYIEEVKAMYDPKNNNEWEEAEREADEDIKMGRVKTFNSAQELIEELNSPDEDC